MPIELIPPRSGSLPSRRSIIGWAILSLLCSLFFSLWNLGYSSYHAEDEALHVSVIQHMLHEGHLVVPHDENGPYFNKPPLKMWATIPFVTLFGQTPLWFRFLDGLAGLMCGLLIFQIGRTLFLSPRAGFLATMFFFTADIVLFDHGIRNAVQDSWLLLFSTAAMWIGYRTQVQHPQTVENRWGLLVVGALTGLSIMVKSAAGFLAPALLGVVWLLQGARRIPLRSVAVAVGFAAAPGVLYGAVVLSQHSTEFLTALNREVVARVTDGFQRQNQPLFYVTLIGSRRLAIEGWWLLISALGVGYLGWKRRFPHAIFLMVWGLGPLVLFSAVKTRLEWYILPAIPAHALIAGWALDRVMTEAARFVFPCRASLTQVRAQPIRALGTALLFVFGAQVFFSEVRRSVLCLVTPPRPIAMDETARTIIKSRGAQSTIVHPGLHTLVPALFERNHLRSLAGGNLIPASSPDNLVELFGAEPGKHRFALTRPEVAAHLIRSGVVQAYRSMPPLMRYPPQHQRHHWLVLLSAEPIHDDSFQSITTTRSLPPEGGIIPLPAATFITKTVGMSVIVVDEKTQEEQPPLSIAVRVYRDKKAQGIPLSCQPHEKQVRCLIPPELMTERTPSFVDITRTEVAPNDGQLHATIRIGPPGD